MKTKTKTKTSNEKIFQLTEIKIKTTMMDVKLNWIVDKFSFVFVVVSFSPSITATEITACPAAAAMLPSLQRGAA